MADGIFTDDIPVKGDGIINETGEVADDQMNVGYLGGAGLFGMF
jgi:hypothetical protein